MRVGVFHLDAHPRHHESTIPSWDDSDNAIAFISEVLKLEPKELLTRFE
jgi:hypothetical protein